jgi:hypothetical protein
MHPIEHTTALKSNIVVTGRDEEEGQYGGGRPRVGVLIGAYL